MIKDVYAIYPEQEDKLAKYKEIIDATLELQKLIDEMLTPSGLMLPTQIVINLPSTSETVSKFITDTDPSTEFQLILETKSKVMTPFVT